jgi:hypothetical protein
MTSDSGDAGEFRVAVGEYILRCAPRGLPSVFHAYARHAALVELFEPNGPDRCCLAVSRANEPWPFLVVAQSFSPAGAGFEPGALLAPDTGRLFVGAGDRLLAYDLQAPGRLWTDWADMGFLGWARHGDTVVMSAELALAAWTCAGEKLWTAVVEPPWGYSVEGDEVRLDVMGVVCRFGLRRGPGG